MRYALFLLLLSTYHFSVFGQVKVIYPERTTQIERFTISAPASSFHTYFETDAQRITRRNPSLEEENTPENERFNNPNAKPFGDDEALQRNYDTSDSTRIDSLSNWAGLSASVDPSDNTLAVSANYVVQMTNNSPNSLMNVWDKAGNLLVNRINTSDLTGFTDFGDPNIIYDWQADRFIFCCLDGNLDNKLVVCISATGDPSGSWIGYHLNFNNGLPDYPKLAVWDNSYFITTNSNQPTVWALNREQMLTGATVGAAVEFNLTRFGTIGFQSASPVTATGANAPLPGEPAVMLRVADDAWNAVSIDKLELYYVSINWENTALSSISSSNNLETISYDSKLCGFDSWNCIPQPGSTVKLHPLGDIIMDKAQYMRFDDHESIVCSHVCKAYTSGESGIRWYELRKADGADWSIYQQGTFAPDDQNYRFMSSVTMNADETMALGYNISSSNIYPSIRLTGRRVCDSLNIMTAPEVVAFDGAHANSINRYGDYNNMVTDPLDGSFWFTSNYNPTASWKTRVVHFKIDACPLIIPDDSTVIFSDLIIAPNPVSSSMQITLTSILEQSLEVKVFDIVGQIVLDQTADLIKGSNVLTLDLQKLSSAPYFLYLKAGDTETTKKFIVQNGK